MTEDLDDIFIASSEGSFRRLTYGSQNHTFFANRDSEGTLNFVFSGNFVIDPKKLQSTRKIDLTFEASESSARLKLSLSDPDVKSIFVTIISDLLTFSNVFQKSSDQVMAEKLLSRYQRWLEIFRRGSQNKLNQNQVLGLAGELLFLKEVIAPKTGMPEAIFAWTGPSPDEQDFLLPNALIEIKSSLQSKDAQIQISSENQLDTVSGRIFIVHQRLKTGQGISLNAIVEDIRSNQDHTPVSRDAFEGKLLEAGYESLADYEDPDYYCDDRIFYEVSEDFPKLIRSELPPAIQRVSYSLEISQLTNFQIEALMIETRYFDDK